LFQTCFMEKLNLCEVLDGRAPAKDSVKYPLHCGDPDAPEPLPVGAVGYRSAPSGLLIVLLPYDEAYPATKDQCEGGARPLP